MVNSIMIEETLFFSFGLNLIAEFIDILWV